MVSTQQATLADPDISTTERIVDWLIFGVVLTLLPFLAVIFLDVDRNTSPKPASLFGHGELLIVAAVIAAGAIGELTLTRKRSSRRVSRRITLGFCIVIFGATTLWFADISALILAKQPPQPQTVAMGSIIIFAFTVIAGLSSLLLSEVGGSS